MDPSKSRRPSVLVSSSVVIDANFAKYDIFAKFVSLVDDQNALGGVPRRHDFFYVDKNFGEVVIENFFFERGSNAGFGDIVKFFFKREIGGRDGRSESRIA